MVTHHDIIKHYTGKGWQVVSQSDNGVQFVKPKAWSKLLLIGGLLGLVFFGAGLILLIFAAIDYAIKKDQNFYVSLADAADGYPSPPNPTARLIRVAALALFVFAAFLALGYL